MATPLHLQIAHRSFLWLRDFLRSRGEDPGVWGLRRRWLNEAFNQLARGNTEEARRLYLKLNHNTHGIEGEMVRLDLLIRRREYLRDNAK